MPKQETVMFRSQYEQLRLVKTPAYKRVEVNNVFWTPSVAAQFIRGSYETSDPEMIGWLRKHPRYGFDFHEVKFGAEPAAPAAPKAPDAPPTVKPRRQVHGARSSATIRPTPTA